MKPNWVGRREPKSPVGSTAIDDDNSTKESRIVWLAAGQNPYVERVIGSIRSECTDHIIPMGEQHLLAVMREYAEYHNRSRTHLSLERNASERRSIERAGDIVSQPVLGGLHHQHRRLA